jgi:hypothetical protein
MVRRRDNDRVNVAIRDEIMREIVDPDVSGAGGDQGSARPVRILNGDELCSEYFAVQKAAVVCSHHATTDDADLNSHSQFLLHAR